VDAASDETLDQLRSVENHRKLKVGMFYNYWTCGSGAWEVDYSESSQIASHHLIQEFLQAWNHNPSRCEGTSGLDPDFYRGLSGGGIGQTYFQGMTYLASALETGNAYHPMDNYFWARPYSYKVESFFNKSDSVTVVKNQNCTLNKPRVDCYFEEISNCDNPKVNTQDEYKTTLGRMLWDTPPAPKTPMDACRLAKKLKKSLAWVAGEYLRYIIRPRSDVLHKMSKYRMLPKKSELNGTSIITIHYRGGKPDWGRKVSPLDRYMDALKVKAAELEALGRPVSVVYLTSIDNEVNFVSPEHMQSKYPAPYRYVFNHRANVPIGVQEIEYYLWEHLDFNRATFVYEMLADIEAMVSSDCFIGSVSNIYLVATFLRYAVRLDAHANKKFNCFINIADQLVREDDERKHEVYDKYMLDRNRAFRDGTPF
jgi:hypothetical protein